MPADDSPHQGPQLAWFPTAGVHRVARREDPLQMSYITAADAETSTGNRYDVPAGGVLYCATDLVCCYAETLARFRPAPSLIAKLGQYEAGRMNAGSVPADWRMRRVACHVNCRDPLPFVDVEDPYTLAYLGAVLAKDLAALGVDEPLNVSHVRGGNRLIPRLISRWAYVQQDEDGNALYSGIRYESKLGDWECWAIFDGTQMTATGHTAITVNDDSLQFVAKMFDLTIH